MRKDSTILLGNQFKNPKTIPLIFHFEPEKNTLLERLQKSLIQHISIEGKDLYLIDRFFQPFQIEEMRRFSQAAAFSRNIYGSPEAIERGEKPASAMNSKEKWDFFANPPKPIQEFYQLLSSLSFHLQADIATLPWELCHNTISSPAVATNYLESNSPESAELGKHRDYHPEEGIAFGIPILYGRGHHEPRFLNGDIGKPWLVSAMIYSTAENFSPSFGMGTTFHNSRGDLAFRAEALPLRIVLFEGDILHSIEPSALPPSLFTWRVSYVFKLSINPLKEQQSAKKDFFDLLGNPLQSVS